MPLRRFLRAYYAYAFLYEFMLGYAIYAAYFQLSGVSYWEFGLLVATWTLVAAIFELPSGALSDRYDRRWLLVAAPLVKAATFVIWALAGDDFLWLAAGFVIWSFAHSLVSGTRQALLFEHLEAAAREADYDKLLGRDRAVMEVSMGIALILGGIVGHFSLAAALWLALPPLALAAIVALWLPDIRRPHPDAAPLRYLHHFAGAVREFRRHADLRYITLYLMFGITLFYILDEFEPLYYLAVDMPIWSFGLIAIVAIIAYAVANLLAHRLAAYRWIGWVLPLLAGICLVIAGSGESPWLLAALIAANIAVAPVYVLAEAKFQRAMEGGSRATTTSAMVFFYCLTGIAMCLAIGWGAERIGLLPTYGWAGAYLVGFALWALRQHRRGRSVI